ncbi:putative ABC-type amino acid transport periplasmic protein [Bdellovibrio bacteriovorus str. Tiberius]|uniref:Putative ABC-type amino acid transport periplasmic protein n=2 Tax=Bdellovibrio bacteriovorus TaxID=959 RepID=K7ZB35_BDEBC|nr:putative ABC-type amino acid transport periplasmic protein [Bdellovibrio bacteriovorus str. Tiberius]
MEAPPFMSDSLPEKGAAVHALRQIFKKNGYDLKVTFTPYLRAKIQALQKDDVSGFFPAAEENITTGYVLSKIMYVTPWGFAERKDKPIHWNQPEDLLPYKIGNVMGYELSRVLAPAQKKKKFQIENVSSDEQNLLKLARKRVDLAFIDATMFEYLMKSSENLRPYQNKLQINAKIIRMDEYGVAFKNSGKGKAHLDVFNRLIQKEEFHRLVELYFKTHMPE